MNPLVTDSAYPDLCLWPQERAVACSTDRNLPGMSNEVAIITHRDSIYEIVRNSRHANIFVVKLKKEAFPKRFHRIIVYLH